MSAILTPQAFCLAYRHGRDPHIWPDPSGGHSTSSGLSDDAVAERFNQDSDRLGSPIVLREVDGFWRPWCRRRRNWVLMRTLVVAERWDMS